MEPESDNQINRQFTQGHNRWVKYRFRVYHHCNDSILIWGCAHRMLA